MNKGKHQEMEKSTTLCQLCDLEIPTNEINDHLLMHIKKSK